MEEHRLACPECGCWTGHTPACTYLARAHTYSSSTSSVTMTQPTTEAKLREDAEALLANAAGFPDSGITRQEIAMARALLLALDAYLAFRPAEATASVEAQKEK